MTLTSSIWLPNPHQEKLKRVFRTAQLDCTGKRALIIKILINPLQRGKIRRWKQDLRTRVAIQLRGNLIKDHNSQKQKPEVELGKKLQI